MIHLAPPGAFKTFQAKNQAEWGSSYGIRLRKLEKVTAIHNKTFFESGLLSGLYGKGWIRASKGVQ
jgi:hypothetical protein